MYSSNKITSIGDWTLHDNSPPIEDIPPEHYDDGYGMSSASEPKTAEKTIKPNVIDDTIINELAKLSTIEYENVRKEKARKFKINVLTLDKLVKDARKNSSDDDSSLFPEVVPWDEAINPEELLTDVAKTIQRFVVCDTETAMAAALWVAMTWFIDVINVAPIAVITAPEKRCGKTQLLSVLGKITYRPLPSSNISPAVLFRSIEKWQPTLLIDETDAFVGDNEELRGLLNAGHTRDLAFTLRCVGEDHEPKKFNLWGAKALSGIGKLPSTLMDRAIMLELRRKLQDEQAERLRHAPEDMFQTLQRKLARFAKDYSKAIHHARPDLPEELHDRAQDNWEPLLAIADTAGSGYGCLARETAIKLSEDNKEAQSTGVELLSDIYEMFIGKDVDRISTAGLIGNLCDDEEKRWASYNFRSKDSNITAKQLASLLVPYGIKSSTMRIGSELRKGYYRRQFEEAFKRYLNI